MTDIQCTPIARLEISPLNARRTHRPDGFGELKASILTQGLLKNLVFTASPGESYRVIAGGRRLEANALEDVLADFEHGISSSHVSDDARTAAHEQGDRS